MYSNGLSEIILGKAIKQLNLPRDEIVIMTKVNSHSLSLLLKVQYSSDVLFGSAMQLYAVVGREHGTNFTVSKKNPDEMGYINQHGLSRKVCGSGLVSYISSDLMFSSL